jgi:hypothetical protein
MESVEWEDYWGERKSRSPKEVYKLHVQGKSIAKIASELKLSTTTTRTLLIRGKVRQFYALYSSGVSCEEALKAVRLPEPTVEKIRVSVGKKLKQREQVDLDYADRINKTGNPFYVMEFLVKHKREIEALLEDMNERAKNKQ